MSSGLRLREMTYGKNFPKDNRRKGKTPNTFRDVETHGCQGEDGLGGHQTGDACEIRVTVEGYGQCCSVCPEDGGETSVARRRDDITTTEVGGHTEIIYGDPGNPTWEEECRGPHKGARRFRNPFLGDEKGSSEHKATHPDQEDMESARETLVQEKGLKKSHVALESCDETSLAIQNPPPPS
ncbi:hypothetical protein ACLOJK_008342 [Asimina triloba]